MFDNLYMLQVVTAFVDTFDLENCNVVHTVLILHLDVYGLIMSFFIAQR